MKRKFLGVCICILLAVTMVGCSGSANASNEDNSGSTAEKEKTITYKTIKPGEKFVLGFSQMENNSPWRVAETESFKALSEQHPDVEVIITDAQSSVSKQVSDCEDLLARGVDVLALAPLQMDGYGPVYDAAKEAGVPIIMVDRGAAGTFGIDFMTTIYPDNFLEGRQVGLWLAANTNGKCRILELEGQAGSTGAILRGSGFHSVIDMFPEMEVIAAQPADFNRMKGLEVMENFIQKFGTEFEAVYAHCDEIALGAIEAMNAANIESKKDIVVVSHDGEKQALEAIMAGDIDFTIECPPGYGPDVYAAAVKLLSGEKLPEISRPSSQKIYMLENVASLYDPDSAF